MPFSEDTANAAPIAFDSSPPDAGTKKYTPDKVAFLGSKLIVSQEHPDLYEWLMSSPYIDNGKNKAPKFREVNPQAKAQSRVEREALRNKAMRLVVDEEALPRSSQYAPVHPRHGRRDR